MAETFSVRASWFELRDRASNWAADPRGSCGHRRTRRTVKMSPQPEELLLGDDDVVYEVGKLGGSREAEVEGDVGDDLADRVQDEG